MASARPIAIYGATGYTGRLVAQEAARRGLALVPELRSPRLGSGTR